MPDAKTVDYLPAVKAKIVDFLDKSDAKNFAARRIKGIEKYGYKNWLSRVDVVFDVWTVSREQVQALVKEIDRYLADPKKNHFHATPMTYKGVTFLLWKDAHTPINRDLKRIREEVDGLMPGQLPAYIFVRIDKKTFQKESVRTHEFLFFPEMNKCIPQPKANDQQKGEGQKGAEEKRTEGQKEPVGPR